jgi:hypothetical protein
VRIRSESHVFWRNRGLRPRFRQKACDSFRIRTSATDSDESVNNDSSSKGRRIVALGTKCCAFCPTSAWQPLKVEVAVLSTHKQPLRLLTIARSGFKFRAFLAEKRQRRPFPRPVRSRQIATLLKRNHNQCLARIPLLDASRFPHPPKAYLEFKKWIKKWTEFKQTSP